MLTGNTILKCMAPHLAHRGRSSLAAGSCWSPEAGVPSTDTWHVRLSRASLRCILFVAGILAAERFPSLSFDLSPPFLPVPPLPYFFQEGFPDLRSPCSLTISHHQGPRSLVPFTAGSRTLPVQFRPQGYWPQKGRLPFSHHILTGQGLDGGWGSKEEATCQSGSRQAS